MLQELRWVWMAPPWKLRSQPVAVSETLAKAETVVRGRKAYWSPLSGRHTRQLMGLLATCDPQGALEGPAQPGSAPGRWGPAEELCVGSLQPCETLAAKPSELSHAEAPSALSCRETLPCPWRGPSLYIQARLPHEHPGKDSAGQKLTRQRRRGSGLPPTQHVSLLFEDAGTRWCFHGRKELILVRPQRSCVPAAAVRESS